MLLYVMICWSFRLAQVLVVGFSYQAAHMIMFVSSPCKLRGDHLYTVVLVTLCVPYVRVWQNQKHTCYIFHAMKMLSIIPLLL